MKNNTFCFGAKLALFLCLLITSTAGATSYTLTVSAQGSGAVTKNPTNATYPAGVVVTLTATPSNGWYFANWSGDTNGSVNPLNVTMNSSLVITGNFLAFPTYSLTLITHGQGAIDLNPPGGSYPSNTLVTVTATPAAGWVFAGWLGAVNSSINPLLLTLDKNLLLTGNFAQLPAFDVQPVSVTNVAGSTVDFSAHAVGTAPLNYQWFFSGGSLNGVTTNSTLALTNISSGQAGNYWVIATNNYGSATSQIASLTLTTVGGPTNVVNSPDEASLRAAIALGGWVGLGFNGTITITNTIAVSNNVILDGSSVGATISGGNAVRLFYVAPGASLSATNLTLANGIGSVYVGVANGLVQGGAIYNDGGNITMVSCLLTNNSATALGNSVAQGGAIFNQNGTVSLFNSLFFNNSAANNGFSSPLWQGGGAIYNTNGLLTVVDCNFSSNQCYTASASAGTSFGGAVFQASGSLLVTNSVFSFNQALGGPAAFNPDASPGYGGALYALGGMVIIDHSQFLTNTAKGGKAPHYSASGYGGAVYCASSLNAVSSTFFGNQALAGTNYVSSPYDGQGGAIYDTGSVVLNGCSLCFNSAQGFSGNGLGGGIFNASLLTATNCTIALNSVNTTSAGSALGGGIYNSTNATSIFMNVTIASNWWSANTLPAGLQIANNNGTLHLHNSLIAGTNGNAYGPITDDGFNICSDGTANFSSGSSFNYTDPQLAPLGDYGGPTLCMALLPASPAIDNGDPSDFPSTDQRGFARPFGSGPDMGAYEFGVSQPGVLQLNIAPATGSVVLSFLTSAPGLYHLQTSTNLTVWTDLNTYGPFAGATNISQTISRQPFNALYFRLKGQ